MNNYPLTKLKETLFYNTGCIPRPVMRNRPVEQLDMQNTSSVCSNNKICKLYPINPVYVNYGGVSIPRNCPCTRYIRTL